MEPPKIYIAGDAGKYRRYAEAVRKAGGLPVFPQAFPNLAPGEYEYSNPERFAASADRRETDCDALLLPGGGDVEPWRYGQENISSRNMDPARDAREFDLLRKFTALKKPVLGICRGMQVINIFFGGDLIQDIPGHGQMNGQDRTHVIYTAPGFFRDALALSGGGASGTSGERGGLEVNSAHHQAAGRLGDGLRAAQWAGDGVIEALIHVNLPVFGVQWHPERLSAPASDALFRAFITSCLRAGMPVSC